MVLGLSRTVVGSACVVVVGCASASSASSTPNSPVTGLAANVDPSSPVVVDAPPASSAREDGQGTREVGPHLDKKQIREVVTNNILDIRDCYNAGLAKEPDLIGRVAIEFVIGPEGAVVRSTIAANDLPESAIEVADCIARATETWTFPREGGENNIIVTYPFNLSPGELVVSQLGGAAAERVANRWFILQDRPAGEVVVEVQSRSKRAPVTDVAVELRVFEGNEASTREASTDHQGQATFVDVPSGTKFKAVAVGHDTSESTETGGAGVGVVADGLTAETPMFKTDDLR